MDAKVFKPIPPSLFSLHIISQLTQCNFLSSLCCSHQNLTTIYSNSSQKFLESLKQLIEYVGIDIATTCIRISLPPWDGNFSFHTWIFCHTRHLISENAVDLLRPIKVSSPKYFFGGDDARLAIFPLFHFLCPPWCWSWKTWMFWIDWFFDQMLARTFPANFEFFYFPPPLPCKKGCCRPQTVNDYDGGSLANFNTWNMLWFYFTRKQRK